MDALNHDTYPDEIPVVKVSPVLHPEFYRPEVMPDDKALLKSDVIARVKAMGVRDYRDRVILAIQNDDLKPEMGGLFSRTAVDEWIDAELAVDRLEDESTLSLAQARALAKDAGIEDYSAGVLNAITRMEIEGVEYRRGQPRIPRNAFEEWLEDQGSTGEVEEEQAEELSPDDPMYWTGPGPWEDIRLDEELKAEARQLMDPNWQPSSGEVFKAGLQMYGWYALGFAACVWVICWVLWNVAHVAG